MEYVSSDTNVWLVFATINKLEIPFRIPYTYIMNEDAVEGELLYPVGLRDNLIKLGLQTVSLSEDEFYLAGEYSAKYNGQRIRLPETELQKRIKSAEQI